MSDKVEKIAEIKAEIESKTEKIEQIEKEQQEVEGKLLREKENKRAGRRGAKTSTGKMVAARMNADKGAKRAEKHYFDN